MIFSHDVYILEKTGKTPSNIEEECIFMNRIKLDGQYHSFIESLVKRIESKVGKSMKSYHAQNHMWVLCPTFLLLLSLFLMWGWNRLWQEGMGTLPMFIFGSGLLTFLGGFIFKTFIRQLMYTLLYIFLIFFLFNVAGDTSDVYQPLSVLFIISTCSIFSYLMYQPTERGQRVIEYLEGLKMFLMATKMPVKKQVEIEKKLSEKGMEKLFPYAMALGLEKEWEKKFKGLFGTAAYGHFVHSHPYTSTSFIHSFSSSTSHSSGRSGGSGGGGGGGGGGGR